MHPPRLSSLLGVVGLAVILIAPTTRAHDDPSSTTFDLIVPSENMAGQIVSASLVGPPAGEQVLHATWDLTFTSPPGGTPASDVILEISLPLVSGMTAWEISGADLGWPAATGTHSATLGSDMLNGVVTSGLPGLGTVAHLHIGAVSGGVTGQFTSSRIILELAGETCQEDLGFQGPGQATLSICGDPLTGSGTATFLLDQAPPSTLVFLAVGIEFHPTPFTGGTFVVVPWLDLAPIPTDAQGTASTTVSGGLGPVTVYLQGIVLDASQPGGLGLTNALAAEFLP